MSDDNMEILRELAIESMVHMPNGHEYAFIVYGTRLFSIRSGWEVVANDDVTEFTNVRCAYEDLACKSRAYWDGHGWAFNESELIRSIVLKAIRHA